MKTLISTLVVCAVLTSATGCIPIGVRGSTFAGMNPACTAPSQPAARAGMTSERIEGRSAGTCA